MRRVSFAVPFAVAVAGLLAATACSAGSVEVPPPHPDAATASRCAKLHDRLPGKLHGQDRRTASPSSDLTAVWGDPAIALRCGVTRPAGLRPTSQLAQINGLSWLPEPEGAPTRFTLLGRDAYVEITVPRTIKLPGEVLSALSPQVKKTLPALPDGRL